MAQIPSQDDVLLLVSDDIRVEPGRKFTLLGMMPGTIQVTTDSDTPALQSISFYLQFNSGEGEFDCRVLVKDPKGTVFWESPNKDKVTKVAGEPLSLAVRLSPFPAASGTHVIEVYLDKTKYTKQFEMKVNKRSAS